MFGLDFNQISNNIQQAQQAQPNQFSDGNLSTPDNTSWMQPSSNFQQQGIQAPSGNSGNTGFAGDLSQVAQSRGQEVPSAPKLQPGNGTAIDAVNNGWITPFAGPGWDGNWNYSQNTHPGWQNGQYYDFGMTPPGGWNNEKGQQTPPQSNAGGNVGQYMPGDVNIDKWNDSNKHDPKYDTERILSKYAPGQAGLDQAMPELEKAGYKRTGKDSVFRPDVGTVDVGFAFGTNDPNQMKWGWMPKGDVSGESNQQQQGNTPMINPQQQIQQFIQNLMNSKRGQRSRLMRQQGSAQIGPYGQPR